MNLHDADLENQIVGGVFLRKHLTVAERSLSTVDFFFATNVLLWSKILECDEEGQPIEVTKIRAMCAASQPSFNRSVVDLLGMTSTAMTSTPESELRRFRDLSAKRRLRKALTDLSESVPELPLASAVDEADNLIREFRKETDLGQGNAKQLFEVMEYDVYPRLDKFVSGETVKMPFGIPLLDQSCNGGAGLGELVIFGAKPKQGKSALTLQVAKHQAQAAIPSMIVSREMLNFENGFRFLAQETRYSNNIFRPKMLPMIADELKVEGRKHCGLPLWFDDRSKKMSEVRREAKAMKETHGLQTVFIDYAQLIRPDVKSNNRAESLEAIYYEAKDLATDLELTVYMNAQFNRQGIQSDRPRMSDFDGSSAAEKAGNLIILWALEDDYDEQARGRKGKLWIEAGRNVGTDEFEVVFEGKHSRFRFN
jgi:replicative DNA helicase